MRLRSVGGPRRATPQPLGLRAVADSTRPHKRTNRHTNIWGVEDAAPYHSRSGIKNLMFYTAKLWGPFYIGPFYIRSTRADTIRPYNNHGYIRGMKNPLFYSAKL